MGAVSKLINSDTDLVSGDRFGSGISIRGSVSIIGASSDGSGNSGSAYVFERNNTGMWSESQKLTASDPGQQDMFGCSVSIEEDTLVVGARGEGTNEGAAYIFNKNSSGVWSQHQKLKTSGDQPFDADFAGQHVAISGNNIIMSSEYHSLGNAYLFRKDVNGNWNEIYELKPSTTSNRFSGSDISISGDLILIGSSEENNSSGAGYIFEIPNKNLENITERVDNLEKIGSGKSAYDIWIENGHTGSETDFLMYLIGAQGIKGNTGDQGVTGETGSKGDTGLTGSRGEIGPQGVVGPAGVDGTSGQDGLDGDDFNGDARLTALETGDTNVANAITTLTGLLTTLQSEFDALETKTQNFGRIRILTKYGNLYEQKEDGSWEDVHAPSLVFSNDTINYWKNSYWHWNKGWRYIPSTDPYGEL